MSGEQNGSAVEEKPKKVIKRKPLWLLVPVGQRMVERADGLKEPEVLYTLEKFVSVTDLRENLEARELDQSNSKGIFWFRGDMSPVETKMRTQIVLKFNNGGEASEEEEGGEV